MLNPGLEESPKDIGVLVYSSFSNTMHSASLSGAHTEAVDHLHSAPVRKDEVLQSSSIEFMACGLKP